MTRDIRGTATYAWAQDHYERALAPGFGQVTNLLELAVSPDGRSIAGTGAIRDALEASPGSRIAVVDVASGDLRLLTSGPHDRCPMWSADGAAIYFLSDRREPGVHQLFVIDSALGEATPAAAIDGIVEYHWLSPSGRYDLLAVAEAGADKAGGQGSGTLGGVAAEELPDWMPTVEGADDLVGWRSLHLYDAEDGTVRRLSREGVNVWEATWLGDDEVLAVVSPQPGEEHWYTAELVAIDIASGKERPLLASPKQIGWPAGNPAGSRAAVVQSYSSDRTVVAGDVSVIDAVSGEATVVDTLATDVTALRWRSDEVLLWCGIRGLETVFGEYDAVTGQTTELLSTPETCGARYPELGTGPASAIAVTLESASRPHTVCLVERAGLREIRSLAHAGSTWIAEICRQTGPYSWTAPDGLEIQGLLTLPAGEGPFPLVLFVHGGPVWAMRNTFEIGLPYIAPLVRKGYAVLRPNPRGSSGRGQDFIRAVYGEMGGADTQDYIAGVESLIADGTADPARLAVTGGSYGGYMSNWLITQTDIFAAAIPIAEVSNWTSQHFTCNIPFFDTLFLGSQVDDLAGHHLTRSPVFFADKVTTPSLHITGALDRCTPPGQALEFHRALREAGKHSELVIYPQEAHGVRQFPAAIDFTARVLDFLAAHCPA
ncbi:MAG TPA: S9 family peptidase [Mycobacteriales bacterium]|nr:S9 family peptidase [Mycobacteriales bacterium]